MHGIVGIGLTRGRRAAARQPKRQEDTEEQSRDEQHGNDGDCRLLAARERALAPVRIGKTPLPDGGYAEVTLDFFLHPVIGEDLVTVLGEQFFHILIHRLPSCCNAALSFFSASLFFHVTVDTGIPVISATSRLL